MAAEYGPRACLKSEGRVTQTYIVTVPVYQSTHAIYHSDNQLNFRSNDVLHDVDD